MAGTTSTRKGWASRNRWMTFWFFVGSVCGTEQDPQDYHRSVQTLRECGVLVDLLVHGVDLLVLGDLAQQVDHPLVAPGQEDPQDYHRSVQTLRECGVLVETSNARAIRLALELKGIHPGPRR